MKPTPNDIFEQAIDRLVDSELTDEEERDLLKQLDGQPNGWRRCALAFIEARVWREAFDDMLDGPMNERLTQSPRDQQFHRTRRSAFATALTLFLAFGFGAGLMWLWSNRTSDGTNRRPIVAQATQNTDHPTELSVKQPASSTTIVPPDGSTSAKRISTGPVMMVGNTTPNWPTDDVTAIPLPVRDALKRLGHSVRELDWGYPARLRDGRTVVIPIQDVHLKYSGFQDFQ